MKINACSVPFCRFLSYLAINWFEGRWAENNGVQFGFWLRKLYGDGTPEVFHLETVSDGRSVPINFDASEEELRLSAGGGVIRLCLAEVEQVRIRPEGVGLRLCMPGGMFICAVDVRGGAWRLNAFSVWHEYMAVPLPGKLELDIPWEVAKCKRMIAHILPKDDGIGEWGLATESPESPLYDPGGYWRRPIWAPSAMILVDGLRNASEAELANTIAERFYKLCANSGFAENFDAGAGAPLCYKAHTWTSSTFLMLASSG